MISTPQPDGTFVTTPPYIGTSAQVEAQRQCPHLIYDYIPGSIKDVGTQWIIAESCANCRCTRARHAPSKELLAPYYT